MTKKQPRWTGIHHDDCREAGKCKTIKKVGRIRYGIVIQEISHLIFKALPWLNSCLQWNELVRSNCCHFWIWKDCGSSAFCTAIKFSKDFGRNAKVSKKIIE
ncbi:uncharacterized protein LOC136042856 isoform X1 [Artemia franciscana]|uniref:uncharacterized protein LOC136042856 isoform X1 n=1 Tax=Artemia franciscana TaxID=6661 RepID=UPI0032DAC02B